MKYNIKILIVISLILIFMPIGLCEKINNELVENTKIYDEKNKSISIYDKDKIQIMHIKLISTLSDIDKFIEVFEITNFKKYKPDKKKDFLTKTKVKYGSDIYKIEYYIYTDISDYKIIQVNKTNKTIKLNDKHIWKKYNPYDKEILKNEIQKIKIIYYKKPELGFFKIQTIPIFHNVECHEMSWFLGNWNLRRPILINNTIGDSVTNYSLKSVNLSEYEINAISSRIINESSGLHEPLWNESVNNEGNLEYVWCNYTNLPTGNWINDTYYIYYQSEPTVNSISNGDTTFLFFDDFNDGLINIEKWNITANVIESDGLLTITGQGGYRTAISNTTKYGSFGTNTVIRTNGSMDFGGYGNNQDIGYLTSYIFTTDYPNANSYHTKYTTTYTNIGNSYTGFHLWEIIRNAEISTIYKIDNNIVDTKGSSSTIVYPFRLSAYANGITTVSDWIFVRKYTTNEPELWTVGDIEYSPELVNVTCNIKILTHLTDKNIKFVDMNGTVVNESMTNQCINLSYDSYIVYMSNTADITSLTTLLNFTNDIFTQFLLISFAIIILVLFYVFIQIIKYKGFKGLK